MAGISRSGSLVIYFLMKKYHLNYSDAEKIVRDRRQVINPNISFKNQLLAYQERREKFTETESQNIVNLVKSRMSQYNENNKNR
jgi:protein-tyrosine phosphatase